MTENLSSQLLFCMEAIDDISEENLKAMLDEFLKEFDQSSVLVEKKTTAHIYYSGD